MRQLVDQNRAWLRRRVDAALDGGWAVFVKTVLLLAVLAVLFVLVFGS